MRRWEESHSLRVGSTLSIRSDASQAVTLYITRQVSRLLDSLASIEMGCSAFTSGACVQRARGVSALPMAPNVAVRTSSHTPSREICEAVSRYDASMSAA